MVLSCLLEQTWSVPVRARPARPLTRTPRHGRVRKIEEPSHTETEKERTIYCIPVERSTYKRGAEASAARSLLLYTAKCEWEPPSTGTAINDGVGRHRASGGAWRRWQRGPRQARPARAQQPRLLPLRPLPPQDRARRDGGR